MRGTIIMWSGERGVVSASGQRYDFDINHWQGATAPAANMTVDLAVAEGSKHAKAIFENVGKDIAIAWA
ncbi:MAG: hypothetical protein ACREVI_05390 [Steroidobacteraceae bacterium]